MAYTEELVSKLSHSVSKETCCRLAMLSAIVKIDGSIHLGAKSAISLELKISNMALSRRIISEFKSLFGLHSEVSLRRINIRGTTQSQILIKSNQLRAVLEKLEVLQGGKLNLGMPKNLIKRTCCKSYFLRGAFMAGGYVNQSAGTAHLEISSENKKLIDELSKMLNEKKLIENRVRKKDNYFSFYIKSNDRVTAFLKLIEAPKEALEFENTAIVKDLKSRANRLANAETANKNKVIKNAFRQIKEVSHIEEALGLSSLSPGLCEICIARLEYPEDSLEELGKRMDPQLSKSAVNHRFRRVREIAGKLD